MDGLAAKEIREAALELLIELEHGQLHVELNPSSDPDWQARGWMVRQAEEENAEWYRNFCRQYTSGRKRPRRRRKAKLHDTLIKRAQTVKALERILEGRTQSPYVERLMPFLKERVELIADREGREGGGTRIVPSHSEEFMEMGF